MTLQLPSNQYTGGEQFRKFVENAVNGGGNYGILEVYYRNVFIPEEGQNGESVDLDLCLVLLQRKESAAI